MMFSRLLLLLVPLTFIACMNSRSPSVGSKPAPQNDASTSCFNCAHGNEQGNGADYYFIGDGSAWFLDNTKQIKYCTEVSEDFGVDLKTARLAIKEAFNKWNKYIIKKGINSGDKSSILKLTVNSTEISSCDGTEDVAFYFGVQNVKTVPYGFQNSSKVATSVRTQYDDQQGWSKGFVWVAPQGTIIPNYGSSSDIFPNWNRDYALSGILTHELGHVYGVEHVNGTIMRKDLANFLIGYDDETRKWLLDSIDNTQELVICDSCDMNYRGAVDDDSVSEAFEVLTGKIPSGSYKSVRSRLSGNYKTGLDLEVRDDENLYIFPLTLDLENKASYEDSVDVFKIVLQSHDSATTTATLTDNHPHGGYAIPGKIISKTGGELNITLERNMESRISNGGVLRGPLVINYTRVNGKVKPLFIVDLQELN